MRCDMVRVACSTFSPSADLSTTFPRAAVAPSGLIFSIAGIPATAPGQFSGDGGAGVTRVNTPATLLPDGYGGVLIGECVPRAMPLERVFYVLLCPGLLLPCSRPIKLAGSAP